MTVRWSAYAKAHYRDIILGIAFARCAEDAEKWEAKIDAAVAPLWDYPQSGQSARENQFLYTPDNFDRLRTVTCRPYVILYEHIGKECRILDILHSRQLFDGRFTAWDESDNDI